MYGWCLRYIDLELHHSVWVDGYIYLELHHSVWVDV